MDRIEINGVWYVREKSQEPLDIIFFDGAVYEDDDYCLEASRDAKYNSITIEIKNKKTGENDYIDNKVFMDGVINYDSKVDFMDEDLLRSFLNGLGWL